MLDITYIYTYNRIHTIAIPFLLSSRFKTHHHPNPKTNHPPIQDVITSSLAAHTVANHTYTPTTALARAHDAIASGRNPGNGSNNNSNSSNPGAAGAAWEGVFTIPVCDVGWAVAADNLPEKAYILQPVGEDYRPRWCGPVCGGDAGATRKWIEAAGMKGFESPKEECEDEDEGGY